MNKDALNKAYYKDTFSEICAPDALRHSIEALYDTPEGGAAAGKRSARRISRHRLLVACAAAAFILAVGGTVYAGANRNIFRMWKQELQESTTSSSLFPNEYETLDDGMADKAALEAITWMQKSVVIPIYEGHVSAYSNEDGSLLRTFSRSECEKAEISDKGEVVRIAGELYIVTLDTDEQGKTSEVRLFPADGYTGNPPVPAPDEQTLYRINEWLSE